MSPATTRRPGQAKRVRLTSGPWKGVRSTTDPFDDDDYLVTGQDGYIPDPDHAAGFYARTAFQLSNSGSPIYATGTFRGQGVYSHVAADGTAYNFVWFGGHLFRANGDVASAATTWTDVTPSGVTIDGATTTRIKMVSEGNNLIVNDHVNRPWLATALSSTPITGTRIQYNAADDVWSAADVTVWQGSVLFGNLTVAGVPRPYDIAWSEPGLPAVGYEQTGSSNFLSTGQTGGRPVTAVVGTNTALFVFKELSITRVTGLIGSLVASNTTDAVGYNVGTRAPQSIQFFGDVLYFTDALGRPYALPINASTPVDIWKQMRGDVDAALARNGQTQTLTSQVTVSGFDPLRNLYLVGIWSPLNAGTNAPPFLLFVFDGRTGRHFGFWAINGGAAVEAMGTLTAADGHPVLVAIGAKDVSSGSIQPSGYVWCLKMPTDANPYTENGAMVPCSGVTGRIGFSADAEIAVDTVTVLANAGSLITVGWSSSGSTNAASVSSNGTSAADAISRYVTSSDAQGKGVQISFSALLAPASADPPACFQQVVIDGTARPARSEEP